jgi:hypothetical protein
MKRNEIIIALLFFSVLIAIAGLGIVVSSAGHDTVNVDCIVDNPDGWVGRQVTLEGVVGLTTDEMFILWNNCQDLSIEVKWAGEPAVSESSRVTVTGKVEVEKLSGEERLYVIAEDWKYVGY